MRKLEWGVRLRALVLMGLLPALSACSTLDFGPEPGSPEYDQAACMGEASRAPVGGNQPNPPMATESWSVTREQQSADFRSECEHAASHRAAMAEVNGDGS